MRLYQEQLLHEFEVEAVQGGAHASVSKKSDSKDSNGKVAAVATATANASASASATSSSSSSAGTRGLSTSERDRLELLE